jgi:hypothetical protein
MRIDIRTKQTLYIEINDYVYYIDDSTNEQIIDVWHKNSGATIDNLNK